MSVPPTTLTRSHKQGDLGWCVLGVPRCADELRAPQLREEASAHGYLAPPAAIAGGGGLAEPLVSVACARQSRSSTFGSSRCPGPLDDGRLMVAGPPRHRDAEELERVDTGAAILECGPDRDVDGNACFQSGCLFTCAVSSPDLPRARENVPELAHRGVDGRPIHLTWRDGGVDHVAGLAFHQVPDLCPCRGAGMGEGEQAGLHGEPPCAPEHYPTR